MNQKFQHTTRFFNELETKIDSTINKKVIVKKSTYVDKFTNEIKWYQNIPQELRKFCPTIINYSLTHPLYIEYTYINTQPLHDYFVNSNSTAIFWKNAIKKFGQLIDEFKKNKPKTLDHKYWKNNLISMYLDKTIERLELISKNTFFDIFIKADFIVINDKKYPSIRLIIEQLKKIKNQVNNQTASSFFKNLCTPSPTNIKKRIVFYHGDLCLSNVFFCKESNLIKVIDPRGSFGKDNVYGDILFEYSKIYQSVYGLYDFVIEDLFKLERMNNAIKYNINLTPKTKLIQKLFLDFFPKNQLKEIKFIESLQFLSMIPWHSESPKHQFVFLCTGIIHFYDSIKDEWKL